MKRRVSVFFFLLLELAVYGCGVSEEIRHNNMKDSERVAQIAEAYRDDGIAVMDVQTCYVNWLALQRRKLETFSDDVVEAVLDDIITEKRLQVAHADANEKLTILHADFLRVQIDSIDRQAFSWARQVLRGQELNPQDRTDAEAANRLLQKIAFQARELPHEHSSSLIDMVSEIQLDLMFALENGSAPKSLRLGRESQ